MDFCVLFCRVPFKKGTAIGARREHEENLGLTNCEDDENLQLQNCEDPETRVKLLERLHFVIMGGIFFFEFFERKFRKNHLSHFEKFKKKNSQFFKRYLRFQRVQPKHLETPHKDIMLLREEIATLFNVLMAPRGISTGVFFSCSDLSNLTCQFFFSIFFSIFSL